MSDENKSRPNGFPSNEPELPSTEPAWREMGLKDSEYETIVARLGREPNYTELGMFSVLWSEHCAYKHSKSLLRRLPTKGEKVMVGPGENAGVVDIGDGFACAFKIESHNHPSAVEPYQAAATGIGGIVRDVLAMGARPVALLDSLRFGPLKDRRSNYLFNKVVAGISGYGNALGVPTVGGEVFFAEPYRQNPLVNVVCAGIMKHKDLHKGRAYGVGNVVMIVGHSTGRDGIHGCTFASEEFGDDVESLRPNVQVGDPFMERLLIEACLEMMQNGVVVGIQDMGAAGITSSCAETAARAGMGLLLDVSQVPKREDGMTAYDVMLSESQERMLVIVTHDRVEEAIAICKKWGVNAVPIGRVTDTGELQVFDDGALVASIPVSLLAEGAPQYDPPWAEPSYIAQKASFCWDNVPVPRFEEFGSILKRLLASPNIASKEPVYRQFDYMAGSDTVSGPPVGSGAVVRVKGTNRAIVLSTDCNGRLVYLNPRTGAKWAVAEAARNVAITGARPVAISNCLNFGNPEKPEIYWQIKEAVEGMAEACEVLQTPVTGGNVSAYNETEGDAVYPTPIIGMLGILEDVRRHLTPGFKSPGDLIGLLGKVSPGARSLAGSEYLDTVHGLVTGSPRDPDLGLERRLLQVLEEGGKQGLLKSAQDLSEGGLAVALAECCILGMKGAQGAEVSLGNTGCSVGSSESSAEEGDPRPDAMLFGECNSAVIVTFDGEREQDVRDLCHRMGVPLAVLGRVGGESLKVRTCGGDTVIDELTGELGHSWRTGILQISR
ncbi:MAG: phosphoribosylformylglycinamidine synthase subunit PurL [Bacillota bacterium]|jgi:phosphoribosylformylglycinamidine synthase II